MAPSNFGIAFTTVTSLSIPGTEHNLNTPNLLVSCYDNSVPANLIEPSHVTVDPASYTVTVSFATAQTGRCALNGSGGLIAQLPWGTASLAFPSISNGACAAEVTFAVTGALPGDSIAEGWPALPAGFIGMMRVSAGGTVAVRMCNFSGTAGSLSSMTYKATIVRGS
jgi:hypothetical protein